MGQACRTHHTRAWARPRRRLWKRLAYNPLSQPHQNSRGLPMNPLPQRTSSAAWVRGIAELFEAEGLPVQALCAQADIDLESLQHPHTRVDVDRVSRLWEAA
eukprot:gene40236-64095_t